MMVLEHLCFVYETSLVACTAILVERSTFRLCDIELVLESLFHEHVLRLAIMQSACHEVQQTSSANFTSPSASSHSCFLNIFLHL